MALGGYARRELCPASDVDVVLLHDGWGRTDLEDLVAQLCYPLWDAGLAVGHSVRTPAEAAAGASERIDTATAVLDRRLVAGDAGLLDALAARVRRWTRRNARGAMVALDEGTRSRHRQHGAVAGVLEPNLKEGAGGLRDIHSLRWGAGWVIGDPTLDGLVTAGYLSAADRANIAGANAALLTARCALHQVETGVRGRDREILRMEWHDDVAAGLGYTAADERGDGETLLHEVLLAMRTVAHLHGRTWPLLMADAGGRLRRRSQPSKTLAPGIRLQGRLVESDAAPPPPDAPWQAVAAVAAHDAPLGRSSVAMIGAALEAGPPPWTAASRAALLDTLAHPGAATALREADVVGLLSAVLPEWERVRARPQRNALHRFDLDTHGARAIRALHRLCAEDEELAALWSGVDDRDALLLATWLHDVGKAWPGDHSASGAAVVRRWLQQMGYPDTTVTRAQLLVAHHLLLPDVATRRDLDDPSQIAAVANAVGTPDALDALYLLSLADSRATGSAAWSGWKDSLLARLHREVRAALGAARPADPPPGPSPLSVTKQALAELHRIAPTRYFDVAGDDQIAAHAALLPAAGVSASIRDGAVPQTAVVSVIAGNRDRLMADCAGVLAGHAVEVYEARAFSAGDVALAWFITAPIEDRTAVVAALHGLGDATTDVGALLDRRRWAPRRRRSGPDPVVTLRDRTVDVEAVDSPALLYRLCAALAHWGYGVAALRVSTLGDAAFDVFDLTRPIEHDQEAALRDALLQAAGADGGGSAIAGMRTP